MNTVEASKTKQNGHAESKEVQQINQHVQNLPNLHEAQESAIDLSSEYWSPDRPGEYKLGIAMSIEESIYEDQETGEEVRLPCVIFIEQTQEGELRVIRNGSKRLVATIDNAVKTGQIELGQTPVKIIFKGKQKNSTNQFMSDRWSVKPLIINA